MARVCLIERDKKRREMYQNKKATRIALLKVARDRNATPEEIFEANLRLAKMPRNSSKNRIRNRCKLTGRSRGNYRKFKMSRIELRFRGSKGELPGLRKSSW